MRRLENEEVHHLLGERVEVRGIRAWEVETYTPFFVMLICGGRQAIGVGRLGQPVFGSSVAYQLVW
jgi:hypothetical protein